MNKDVAVYKVKQLTKFAGYKPSILSDERNNEYMRHDSEKDKQIKVRIPGLIKSVENT